MPNPWNALREAASFIIDVGKKWYFGGIGDLAAGVTFWIMLTLPAAFLAMVSALGWLGSLIGHSLAEEVRFDVLNYVDRIFTSEAHVVIDAVESLFDQKNSGLVTVSLAFAMWTISRGFAGLLRAVDQVYDVEEGRPWYTVRFVALILGIGTLLLPVPLVLLEVFVWPSLPESVVTWVSFGASVVIYVVWASLLFHFGSSTRAQWRMDLPGAFVAALLWWFLTLGFRYYVQFASGENAALGTIGAWLVALTWMWMMAQAFLIGAAVNAVLAKRMGVVRGRSDWRLNEKIFRTGEMRRIDVADADT